MALHRQFLFLIVSTIYFNKGKQFFREKRVYLFLPRSLGKIELEAQWACAVHLSFCFEET
jgi:hypothetical protein